jgi:hypothetical protein
MKDLKKALNWLKTNKDTLKTFAFLLVALYFLLVGVVTNVIWLVS